LPAFLAIGKRPVCARRFSISDWAILAHGISRVHSESMVTRRSVFETGRDNVPAMRIACGLHNFSHAGANEYS
jgi:hypothetical protein